MTEIMEKAKAAVRDAQGCGLTRGGKVVYCDQCGCEQIALAVIAVIMPYAHNSALENAAKVAEITARNVIKDDLGIPTAIRALKGTSE